VTVRDTQHVNCAPTTRAFDVGCAQPSVAMVAPANGSSYGKATSLGNMMPWEADPNDNDGMGTAYDNIAGVTFSITPSPYTAANLPPQWAIDNGSAHQTESFWRYCGFKGENPCPLGDVSGWPNGSYVLNAYAFTKNYGCGVLSSVASIAVTINNCLIQFFDDFLGSTVGNIWRSDCTTATGCNAAGSSISILGNNLFISANSRDKDISNAAYVAWLQPSANPYTSATNFSFEANIVNVSNPTAATNVRGGIYLTDTSGTTLTRFVRFTRGNGSNTSALLLEYNNGAGTVTVAPASGAPTTVADGVPFQMSFEKVGNVVSAYISVNGAARQLYGSATVNFAGNLYPGLWVTTPFFHTGSSATASMTVDKVRVDCK